MRHALSLAWAVTLLSACASHDVGDTNHAAVALEQLRTGSSSKTAPWVSASLERAVARISDLQADSFGDHARNGVEDEDPDDGGWDWLVAPSATSHSTSASPDNLFGAVGLAPWAVARGVRISLRTAATALDTAWGARRNVSIDSPTDIVFLVVLDKLYPGPRWAHLARERYDARVAAAGGALALGEAVRDARHAAGADGLIAYDLGWFALSALALDESFPHSGYDIDFVSYVEVVASDLTSAAPRFDHVDPSEAYYVQGLAWSALVATWDRGTAVLASNLQRHLLALQMDDGSWPYNADYPGPHLQSTAHVLMTLGLTHRGHALYGRGMHDASTWLQSKQAENGGWPYTSEQEYPLLDAEIALAIYLGATKHSGLSSASVARSRMALTSPISVDMPPISAPIRLP